MKSNKLVLLFLFAFFSISAFGQNSWLGEYSFDEDGGETTGGSRILVAHTIKITEQNGKLTAHIYSQGFQTSVDLYTRGVVKGDRISLYFVEKGKDHVFGEYKTDDFILSITKNGDRFLTEWGAFKPLLDKNKENGFERFVAVGTSSGAWNRLSIPGSDVSVSLPSNHESFLMAEPFYFTYGQWSNLVEVFDTRIHSASFENTFLRLESYQVRKKIKEVMSVYKEKKSFRNKPKSEKIKVGKTPVEVLSKRTADYFRESWYFIVGDRFYVISAFNKQGNRAVINRFFNSLRIGEASPMQASVKPDSDSGSFDLADSKLFVISKAPPSYAKLARQLGTTGTVRISCEFGANGLAKNLAVVKSLPNGLDRQSTITTAQMLFFPAVDQGKYIGKRKKVEYSFSIF